MLRRRYCDLLTSSVSGDDDSDGDPFAQPISKDFVLPSPRRPSDNEKPSPSQYLLGRLLDDAAESFNKEEQGGNVPESDDGDDLEPLRPRTRVRTSEIKRSSVIRSN
jgi:hypothetical protein